MSVLRYEPPLAELRFILRELLQLPAKLRNLPAHADLDVDTIEVIVTEAARFAAERVLPLNAGADAVGCVREADGSVRTPPGFREAYAAFREGGWTALCAPVEEGGQALPRTVFAMVYECLASASHAFVMYSAAGHCAAECLRHDADDSLRERWLPSLADGSTLATMCLSEPQAGSDVGLAATRALLQPDGTYRLHGTKIFASGGEHDLTGQIVHLVLARLPDAPTGTRGLTLFLVPKVLDDGRRNAVFCDGIEHKMGLHGSATCTMRFDGAVGWRLGEANGGLRAMFPMMNEARLLSGLQATGMAECAYQNALQWARERRQGRRRGERDTCRLVDHADVQRMLLTQRSLITGGRMLALQVAWWIDESLAHADPDVRAARTELVELLTPVVKAFLTENAQQSLSLALQVHGGYGFIRETGIEQLVRDARVTTIYEGTTGIQAQDLLMRKVLADGGHRLQRLTTMVDTWCVERADATCAALTPRLRSLVQALGEATDRLAAREAAHPGAALSCATAYLRLVGHLALAWIWARAVAVDEPHCMLAAFYFDHILPETSMLLAVLAHDAGDWAALLGSSE